MQILPIGNTSIVNWYHFLNQVDKIQDYPSWNMQAPMPLLNVTKVSKQMTSIAQKRKNILKLVELISFSTQTTNTLDISKILD